MHDHRILYWLHSAVIMPDHVHAILTPYEQSSLSTILDAIKGASAHLINRNLGRRGHLWQDESFDRILRAGEEIRKKPSTSATIQFAQGWPLQPMIGLGYGASGRKGAGTAEGGCPPLCK
ncbi:MAG: hypothetical protein DMF58_00710 [Acidobacteria bacterium]|nr:MAG: hypothetical protein DMF58_00710 [Acidobacteriota bacterium]